ncbi:LexA family protein [Legionella longbeachae]|uniref:LexA family protein n=1 Tax=Legionella longbeachae TaxID=450 RepID=UPI001404F58A|nr:translesion error-prone DNA polymerase V autoproteolytic subunit [Legionella longbeachae]QIN32765.1 translesion error-prone DNA polymerase V autoproteolytic subunit [Legionella longbeachae]
MTQKGGKRPNAGRPKWSKYKEPTKPIRIPLSKITHIQRVLEEGVIYKLPLYGCKVRAGFPSPADDYIESYLDLNNHLIAHPASTFFVRASGEAMIKAGIADGDLLIVDRSVEPTHGRIVIAALNGELTVKRLSLKPGQTQLIPENDSYEPINVTEELELVIWGVVIHNIRSVF